jgi:hypothetical protein
MTKRSNLLHFALIGLLLGVAGILFAQATPDRALFVNGKPSGTVTQVGGHSYIDIDTVAQITNGTVTVEPNRILLNIPTNETSSTPNPAPAQAPQGLSKEFARAAIADLAEMREWRGAVGAILQYGSPIVGTWPQDYYNRVDADLMQAEVAATTAADHDAAQLLKSEFSNLSQWANGIISARQALDATNSVNPNALQNDPLLAKVSDCSRFLSSMLVSGNFSDDSSCH